MGALPEAPAPVPAGPGFTVSHQKLELDIDFATRSVKGRTEITIHPTHQKLKSLALNCRQCVVTRLRVNGKAPSSKYDDPYKRAQIQSTATVHQHHQLRQKIASAIKEHPAEQLTLHLPKSVQIEELDPAASEAAKLGLTKPAGKVQAASEDGDLRASTPVPKSADEPATKFKPLTIYVEFTLESPKDGLQFIGCEDGDLRYPHVYTRNSSTPGSISSVFPCVDDITSRHTWEISIKCARTLGDAFRPRPANRGVKRGFDQGPGASESGSVPPASDGRAPRALATIAQEDTAREISVMCSGELVDEVADREDPTKKVTSFVFTTGVSPQHIGFAVGPFEYVDLSEFREVDEDERLGHNAVQLHGYCLPGREDELRNTCFPTAKAIDFFTLTYGSYPYNSYSVCFVDDLPSDITKIASCSICSNRLLFPDDVLEPIDTVTRQLTEALASQWFGIDIIAKEHTDAWIIVGLAYFITDMFMKKLCGNNDYRFRQKLAADRVCDLDVGRPSLAALGPLLALDPAEREFMELKAPLVLFILDRRLAKASGSAGLSRVISRILLNAKVGELANGCITTAQFLRICEKLGHTKLDSFFQQWVYGSGCPRFVVTQRFNKKKLVVEMLIRQVQAEQTPAKELETETFIRDVKEGLAKVDRPAVRPIFTGSMTIRIHEADGTPYEHIVEIREASTKFEIPYNTKYKRLKRSRRQNERAAAATGVDAAADGQEDALLYCLGDVLQSEEEVRAWRLSDWTKEEEDKMSQESYEWIRMDADFEWISRMSLTMPWYMYLSQLQQDRDVVAQYESVRFIASRAETALASTMLVRILMDRRYFHGIRTAAAQALARCARDELDWIGLFHLEKAFREMFCYPDSTMTRSNDFSDRTAYFMQCAIPQAMAKVRDNSGRTPLRVQRFLLDLLRFNDNSNNEFSDAHYLAAVMQALCDSLIAGRDSEGALASFSFGDDDEDDEKFAQAAVEEIERYGRMDQWIHSYQNVFSRTALRCRQRLLKAKVINSGVGEFLQSTQPGNYSLLRLSAFKELVELGKFRDGLVMRYLVRVMSHDPSPFIRDGLRRLFFEALAAIAIGTGKEESNALPRDGLIIEQESSTDARKAELSRKQTVTGALTALREEMGEDDTLKRVLWEAIQSKDIGLYELRDLLDLCSLLYIPKTSLLVELKLPRYWEVRNMGNKRVRFTQTGNFRSKPMAPRAPEFLRASTAVPSAAPTTHGHARASTPSSAPPKAKKGEESSSSNNRDPSKHSQVLPPLPKITFKKRPRPIEDDDDDGDADEHEPDAKRRAPPPPSAAAGSKAKHGHAKEGGGAGGSGSSSRRESAANMSVVTAPKATAAAAKGTSKAAPKAASKTATKTATKTASKGTPKAAPKAATKGVMKTVQKDERKDERKEERKEERKAAPALQADPKRLKLKLNLKGAFADLGGGGGSGGGGGGGGS